MKRRSAPAGRIAYVNGRYLPHGLASVHIEDRGLQFADAVYEVCAISKGVLLDESPHLERLKRSLDALGMAMPMEPRALKLVMRELVRRNRISDGMVYLQVTRGAYRRDHAAPDAARSTLILTARAVDQPSIASRRQKGVAVSTQKDIRWGRCDIKSTALLPNILAKTEAKRAGAYEAWLVDEDGYVTEGASTNAWIVTKDGEVRTRHLTAHILPGVTRGGVIRAASAQGIRIVEKAFSVAEALNASEAFLTAATAGVMPVVSIDGKPVGGGRPGPVTARLQHIYRELAEKEAKN